MVERIVVRHILAPTDCSESSRPAMRRALSLARWFGARATALHVLPALPGPGHLAWVGDLGLTADDVERARAGAAKALERFMEPFLAMDFDVDMKTVVGVLDATWREITEEAKALPADLVVMGTHGRGGLGHFLMGSVAEKVMRGAPCPVLVVGAADAQDAARPLFRRIVCATDLAAGSTATVDTALSLARENLARLILLHVVEGGRGGRTLDVDHVVPEAAAFRRALVDRAQRRLHELGAGAHSFADVTACVETGTAWEEVVRVAEREDADLIVVGAHAGGALGRLFLGSTAHEIVRHARCPVLVAREERGAGATPVVDSAEACVSNR